MNIKAVILWDKYTRLVHWLLAVGIVFLSLSGWLMNNVIDDAQYWVEWHQIIGQLLVVVFMARIVLFFMQGNSHFSRLFISKHDVETILQTLKFYISLARTQLPAWYAINPVWRIMYSLFYILLLIMLVSGLIDANNLLFGIYWPSVHQNFALIINAWLVLHVLAMFVHDWKSTVNRISSMISGVAYFETEETTKGSSSHIIKTSFDINK